MARQGRVMAETVIYESEERRIIATQRMRTIDDATDETDSQEAALAEREADEELDEMDEDYQDEENEDIAIQDQPYTIDDMEEELLESSDVSSEPQDMPIRFIVVPEDKFVKLEDYNQLAQLVVQMNSKLAELESEKFQLETRMLNMHLELTNKFIFQDNEMQTYVNSKTSDIQHLLESQIQEIRNQNLIRVECDSTEQLTMKPVFIPEPSIKSKAKKGKATWDTTTTVTME